MLAQKLSNFSIALFSKFRSEQTVSFQTSCFKRKEYEEEKKEQRNVKHAVKLSKHGAGNKILPGSGSVNFEYL